MFKTSVNIRKKGDLEVFLEKIAYIYKPEKQRHR